MPPSGTAILRVGAPGELPAPLALSRVGGRSVLDYALSLLRDATARAIVLSPDAAVRAETARAGATPIESDASDSALLAAAGALPPDELVLLVDLANPECVRDAARALARASQASRAGVVRTSPAQRAGLIALRASAVGAAPSHDEIIPSDAAPPPPHHGDPRAWLSCVRQRFFDATRPEMLDALTRARFVVFDFDGVMTDNTVVVHQDGTEGVLCNRSDGLGIGMLKAAGVGIAVISMEENPVVRRRCDKLKIECVQGERNKLPTFRALLARHGQSPADAAYVGNDVNDLECLADAGVGIAVADAHDDVLGAVRFATRLPGGRGAVREVCDLFLAARA